MKAFMIMNVSRWNSKISGYGNNCLAIDDGMHVMIENVFYEIFINHVVHEFTSNSTITFININHDGKNIEDGGHSHCLELMNFQIYKLRTRLNLCRLKTQHKL
jgi:hypothetical protein